MAKTYSLVEPCCGSAALTLHLLGAKKPLLPYQGSKWKLRHELEKLMGELGFSGPPLSVTLADVGPWAMAMGAVLQGAERSGVIDYLRLLNTQDPREVFDRLQGKRAAGYIKDLAAELLFLQRLAFSGKAVGIDAEGRWKSPGFNKTSAYGTPATPPSATSKGFGEVKPQVPSLIRRLESYTALHTPVVAAVTLPAKRLTAEHLNKNTLVYFDPPYAGTTKYPNGDLSRREVVNLALAWAATGATVVISEAEPIRELVVDWGWGWECRRLQAKRADGRPFQSKKEEWVTFKRGGRHV